MIVTIGGTTTAMRTSPAAAHRKAQRSFVIAAWQQVPHEDKPEMIYCHIDPPIGKGPAGSIQGLPTTRSPQRS